LRHLAASTRSSFCAKNMRVHDDPRDQQPATGIQLLTWVLSDDRRTSRAIRLVLSTAVWTAPPAIVIGVLIGLSGAGAGQGSKVEEQESQTRVCVP